MRFERRNPAARGSLQELGKVPRRVRGMVNPSTGVTNHGTLVAESREVTGDIPSGVFLLKKGLKIESVKRSRGYLLIK